MGPVTPGTGRRRRRLLTEHGEVRIETPRDRKGTFEPRIVRKRQRRFEGFDDKILALYSRGLSTRDIEAHLEEIYGVKVGRDLISRVTDAVMDDVRAWQTAAARDVYPVVFLDALVLKIRDGGSVQRKACYLALAITMDGEREVLGIWFQDTEGAKFWMQVLTDLKTRGVRDILICCVDGLQGLPRGDRGRLPADGGADLHRAPDPPEPPLRPAPPVRPGRQRPPADLHRRQRRSRPGRARGVRRQVGQPDPGDRPGLAQQPGSTSPRSSRSSQRCVALSTRRMRLSRECGRPLGLPVGDQHFVGAFGVFDERAFLVA